MLRWSINLFRIRGIPLAMHWSFLLVVALWAYDGYEDGAAPGAVWSVALMLSLFVCIVLHELAHSFAAMHYGIGVRRILLMPIGGMAEFESIPRSPVQELLITLAGPAVNFILAGLLWLFHAQWTEPMRTTPADLREFGYLLMLINLGFGCFNLIPAFPMDGGRIVRALLALRLPYVRATFWAATIGKVVAVAAIGAAVYYHAWLGVALFLFILSVGEIEYRAVRVQEKHETEWAAIAHRLNRVARGEIPPDPPLIRPN
jgi:Zn-dependent protease